MSNCSHLNLTLLIGSIQTTAVFECKDCGQMVEHGQDVCCQHKNTSKDKIDYDTWECLDCGKPTGSMVPPYMGCECETFVFDCKHLTQKTFVSYFGETPEDFDPQEEFYCADCNTCMGCGKFMVYCCGYCGTDKDVAFQIEKVLKDKAETLYGGYFETQRDWASLQWVKQEGYGSVFFNKRKGTLQYIYTANGQSHRTDIVLEDIDKVIKQKELI